MTESLYSVADRCHEVLKLDFSADEFARVAAENDYSVETISAMSNLFDYLCSKKEQATIQMLLQTSRLPTKNSKTFGNCILRRPTAAGAVAGGSPAVSAAECKTLFHGALDMSLHRA